MAAASSLSLVKCSCSRSLNNHDKGKRQASQEINSKQFSVFSRRTAGISALTISYGLHAMPAVAEEEKKTNDDTGDVLGAIKSIFDPNEKSKSGKSLPKAYLKSAREVVKTLKESLLEDSKDVGKFRRTADAAKQSIREYLNSWRGQQSVAAEESYVALEKAIRLLAEFYSKAGPFASLSEEVKSKVMDDLNTADAFL